MNLWAEFDNEQLPGESAGRAQKQKSSQGRRLTEQVVLSSLRDWLLHDYVGSYCRSLAATRIYRRCYWIDGLGLMANMLQPVVSLSHELAQESRPITLHSIVLEARSRGRLIAPIGRATENENAGKDPAFSLPKESGIVHASWLELASTLLPFIDQSPAIFLLNPFGHTLFTYDDLAPLYSRTAPTELCLLISHKQLETKIIPSLRAPVGAAALTALLRNDRWKALVSTDVGAEASQSGARLNPSRLSPLAPIDQPSSPIDGIIDLFIASMQRHFLSVQRIALPVQVRPAVVEIAPYTLIFATRRQDSLISMNDAVCLDRRRLYEQSLRGVLVEDWFAGQQRERLDEQVQQLYARTLQQGRSQGVRRWPDLRQQLLLTHFGQFTLHDYDEIIRKLLLSGEVRCEWRQRLAPTGNAEDRIPGNNDILLWKQK